MFDPTMLKANAGVTSTLHRVQVMQSYQTFPNQQQYLEYALANFDRWSVAELVRYLDQQPTEKLELPWEFRRLKRLDALSESEIQRHYDGYFNQITGDVGTKRQFSTFTAVLRELKITLPPDATVLEVGCGRGRFMARFMNAFKNPIVGVDINLSDLLINNKIQDAIGHTNYALYAQNGEDLPFKDRSFDFVVSFDALEHVGDMEAKRRFVAELKRVCRGALIIYCPNRFTLLNRESHVKIYGLGFLPRPVAVWLVKHLRGMPYSDIDPPTLFQMKRLLDGARIFPYHHFSNRRARYLIDHPIGNLVASGYVGVAVEERAEDPEHCRKGVSI